MKTGKVTPSGKCQIVSKGSRRFQPLTAPDVRPLMNSFWRKKNSTAGGIIASAVPARKIALLHAVDAEEQVQHHRHGQVVLAVQEDVGPEEAFQLPRNATRQNAAAMGRTSGITTRK